MNLKLLLVAFIAFLCAPSVLGAQEGSALGGSLRISGSGTVLPLAQRTAEHYLASHPDLVLSVSGTGSGDGLKAIVEGTTDVANSSRDLSDSERQRAAKAGVELIRHPVALDCVVVVVNPQNPINNLSISDLKAVYTGDYYNWRDLGGFDKQIIAINRDVSSGTFELWYETVLQGRRPRVDAQVQASSGAVAQAVAGNKYAIGYVGLGYVNPRLKVVSVEGVYPSVATVGDKSYPLSRELYMFTRGGGKASAEDFIKYVQSDDGQNLVQLEGFVPLPKMEDKADGQ